MTAAPTTAQPSTAAAAATDWPSAVATRLAGVDWPALGTALDADGHARIAGLLPPEACRTLAALYASGDADPQFRRRVVMARHGYGRGEYRYFEHPLPPLVAALRSALYAALQPIADRWHAAMGEATRFPPRHADFLARCHAQGQCRPTPLLLQYGPGDHNCLHQDLYGPAVFPLQAIVLLSQPGHDFTGGELVMTEQRPRRQPRPMVLPLQQGDAAVVAVHARPVPGTRDLAGQRTVRAQMRHGVASVRGGRRHTLGILFHDAA